MSSVVISLLLTLGQPRAANNTYPSPTRFRAAFIRAIRLSQSTLTFMATLSGALPSVRSITSLMA